MVENEVLVVLERRKIKHKNLRIFKLPLKYFLNGFILVAMVWLQIFLFVKQTEKCPTITNFNCYDYSCEYVVFLWTE